MFEHRSEALLSRAAFLARLGRSFVGATLIVVFSLWMGSAGYHYFGGLDWIDALLNASMILTGMGPVNAMTSDAGKLFATFYALYSGIAFLTMMAVLLAPLMHRLLHRFHLQEEEERDPE
jgi:Kef-type K+ transport system membrane component KefB